MLKTGGTIYADAESNFLEISECKFENSQSSSAAVIYYIYMRASIYFPFKKANTSKNIKRHYFLKLLCIKYIFIIWKGKTNLTIIKNFLNLEKNDSLLLKGDSYWSEIKFFNELKYFFEFFIQSAKGRGMNFFLFDEVSQNALNSHL